MTSLVGTSGRRCERTLGDGFGSSAAIAGIRAGRMPLLGFIGRCWVLQSLFSDHSAPVVPCSCPASRPGPENCYEQGLSVVRCRFLGMGTITDPEQATTVAASVCDALTRPGRRRIRASSTTSRCWNSRPPWNASPGSPSPRRLQLTGEIDTRRIAAAHGYPNTAALLRNTLQHLRATTPPPGSPPPAPSSRNHC